MSEPIAAVVITTRDRSKLAQRAVESALAQTMRDIDVIIVDDASSEPFHWNGDDSRVRVLRREICGGVCAARNAGLSAARGDWITFLDDDDELLPQMLESSLSAAKNSVLPPPVAVLSGIEVIDESGKVIANRVPVTLPRGSHYFLEGSPKGQSFRTQMSLVAPLAVVREIGGWDEALRSWVHDDFFLRLNAKCSILGQSALLYRQTRHSGGHVHANLPARAEAMELTLQKHRDVFALYPRRRAHFMGSVGITYLRAGMWLPAVRATTRSLLLGPRRPKLLLWWLASIGGPRMLSFYRLTKKRWTLLTKAHPRRKGSSTNPHD